MRLLKKITYERFHELNKEATVINSDGLNFYLVIEYENAFDSVNFDEMFPENSIFVDFQALRKEHSNIISKIKKQIENKKIPDYLKKLGVTNIIKGCYLVYNTSKEFPENIKKSSKNFYSLKLDYKNLPKEISDMCEEYYSKNSIHISKEKDDFDAFFKLTLKEQEKEMAIFFHQYSNYTNKSIIFSVVNPGIVLKTGETSGNLTIEERFEQKIPYFTDINLLEQVLEKAKKDENYELCIKIKERINFLKNNLENL
jgi:hypothetical protein